MARKLLSDTQKEMLRMSDRLADNIISEHPEWADIYAPGTTIRDVAEKVGLYTIHTEDMAYLALRTALKQILGERKFREIAAKNLELSQERAMKEGTGIFAPDHQAKLSEYGRKGGATNGKKMKEDGKGLFAIPLEDCLDNASVAGRNSAIARGHTPYITKEESPNGLGELEYALRLASDPTIVYPEGHPSSGRPNYNLIVEMVNETYHQGKNVRKDRKILRAAVSRFVNTNVKAMNKLVKEMISASKMDDIARVHKINSDFESRYQSIESGLSTEVRKSYDHCRNILVFGPMLSVPLEECIKDAQLQYNNLPVPK